MFNSVSNDPISSWGYQNETTTNASGITFAVKFVGYVPVWDSIFDDKEEEKDALVKLCVNTVVSSSISEDFYEKLQNKKLGEFVSVHKLDVFLNIANFTITFFHIYDNKTFLLGRYMNNRISHYKPVVVNNQYYVGLVMVNRAREEKRECNVLMLSNKTAQIELIEKLKSVDNPERCPASELHSRLKSTSAYNYRIPMLSCYHGNITEREAYSRLKKPGDFLYRDSQSKRGAFTISYCDNKKFYSEYIEQPGIYFFIGFQKTIKDKKYPLKNPVLRPQY